MTWRADQPWDATAPAVKHKDIGWVLIGAGGLGVLGFNAIFRRGPLDDRNDPPGESDRLF